ncbi:cytochrome C peroxidase [Mastigocoleus testarum BC008]|uniref:Cytochrome C peroxidase n=2 Tax=Mastigocoleus TaxID=996924 RepID=A0A0V7ZV41_9CYAN|nr:cytochrome C peroxidase [Mastigocoleus testarum BC008]KST68668.1 cytochrome C peroxidase [Mastigocoleus testarum BC008]
MNDGWNGNLSNLIKSDILKRANQVRVIFHNLSIQIFAQLRSKLLNFAQLIFSLSSTIKKGTTITILVIAIILAGNTVSAQLNAPEPPPSLKTVQVPEPDNLGEFVKDKVAAIELGKALFWDMQVGSDGISACASCHFHAGADNRSKNQLSPGLLIVNQDRSPNPDTVVSRGGINYQLKPEDFPFHKLQDPDDKNSTVLADTNDVVSSQGVFNSEFVDVVPGRAEDKVNFKPDEDGFRVGNTNVRRVEARHSPSVINAVFNFRNLWDGRAQDIFNGVNEFGLRDPNASTYKVNDKKELEITKVRLNNSSLASQAVGPPLSALEQSADGRTFQEIGDKFGLGDSNIKRNYSASKGRKLPRKLAKKVMPLRPLGRQIVDPEDSVLGDYSRGNKPGLTIKSYQQMIESAFNNEWWDSKKYVIQVADDGSRTVTNMPDRNMTTKEYTLMEYNFPLFFGLAVQMYEATLVSDDTPYDRFREGNANALTVQQKQGLDIFMNKGLCILCHDGAEFTNASVESVQKRGRLVRAPIPGNPVEDNGLFRLGTRPNLEDLGIGGEDPFGNSFSEGLLAQQGKFKEIFGEEPNFTPDSNEVVNSDGAFKTPGIRNIELTAPYMHNGGLLTLREVVDFYNRGGDFPGVLPPLDLTEEEKEALVAFMKGLNDERVRFEKAPFDHPQLFVPNGHPGDETFVDDDGTGKATDSLLEISAVGRNGRNTPIKNFLE